MPVISSRRSSNSGSSSLYRTSAASSSGSSYTSSCLDRMNSLSSKPSASSSLYTPSYNYLSSSSYLSPVSPSRNTPSYLSGSSSVLGTYRTSSAYLGAGSNDSITSSRYGLSKKPYNADSLKQDTISSNEANGRKPPSGSEKRFSSLARLVATSGLDIYEKYSPAHYKTTSELSRSRSATSTDSAYAASDGGTLSSRSTQSDILSSNAIQSSAAERSRNRISQLYGERDRDRDDSLDRSSSSYYYSRSPRGSLKLSNSTTSSPRTSIVSATESSNDIPTATFTLRTGSRATKTKANNSESSDYNISLALPKHKEISHSTRNDSLLTINSDSGGNVSNGLTSKNKDINVSCTESVVSDNVKTGGKTSSINNNSDNNDNGSLDDNVIDIKNLDISGSGSADASTTVNLTTDDVTKSSQVRSITSRNVPSTSSSSSTTSSRYWDRDGRRTSTASQYKSAEDKSNDEKKEGLCGLRNIGNTCFMNSVIQCLSHTSELTKFLRTQSSNFKSTSSTKDQQILQEFAKLIREMWTSNVHSVTPMDLKRAFSTKHRMYSDYNQQDAQEFLRFFLDSLHSAMNTGVKGEPLKIDDNLSDNKKADLTWEWYSRHENSLIREMFVGQLKSTLKCTICGNTSVTFDPFWDLSVSLPSSSRCKLDACLDLFIREEILDGDEMPTCAKCQTRRKCTKSFTIQRFPKYLVIHLKRFSETRWSKLSNIVEFPTTERELNMGPYGSNANNNVYYSLYAVSNHMGSTAGGHYVALCKHPVTKQWHEFNDNIVSDALAENHLVSSSAYILFYERS